MSVKRHHYRVRLMEELRSRDFIQVTIMPHSDQTLIQTEHSVQLIAYASLVEQSYQQKLTLLMIIDCQYTQII